MRSVVIILISVTVFLGGLVAAGALTPRINKERQEQNLTVSDTLYDLPPEMAVAQAALGTFRGLAINVLWQRADSLKNQGKFHDAIELGKLITKLQPRYPKVWEFVSWNLSYNISVATHTPEERWVWVKSGLDILQSRGGGIDANPNELALYQQLGWIYYHKVGEFLDNMSWHYKREFADVWHSILGNPPRDHQEYLRWFDQVVQAPEHIDDLPPGARRLAEWMRENQYAFDRHTLRRFTVATRLEEELPDPASLTQPTAAPKIVPELSWPEWAAQPDIDAVLAFVRRKAITGDELNMDPAIMYRYAERFGPIDWRHPAAHCVYWSLLGLERLTADNRLLDTEINTKRNVMNGLERLAHSGQVVFVPAPEAQDSYISYLPAWSFWLAYEEYFQTDVINDPGKSSEYLVATYGLGHRNKMDYAIAATYAYGDEPAADLLYQRMHERVKDDPAVRREYEVPLSDFAFKQFQDSMDQPQIVRGLIVGLLTQSITESAMHRDTAKAQVQYETAQRLHQEYRRLNPNPNDPLYQEMPDFDALNINAMASFVAGSAGPAGRQRVPLPVRAAVYAQLHEQVRALIHLQSGRDLAAEAASEGYDVNTLFPRPSQAVMDAAQRLLVQGAGAAQGGGARPEVR
jgi:hypothetical protein